MSLALIVLAALAVAWQTSALDLLQARQLQYCYNQDKKVSISQFNDFLLEKPARSFGCVTGAVSQLVQGPFVSSSILAHQAGSTYSCIREQATLKHVDSLVLHMYDRLDADNSTCHLNVLLMYELYHDDIMASLLPINSLRNAALLAVTTPLAAMVDVDLLVSASLAQEMADSKMAAAMLHNCTDERRVVVLPAFETASLLSMTGGWSMASRAAAGSKQALQGLYSAGSVTPFGVAGHVNYAPGHAATEYPRWFATDAAYRISAKHAQTYEPWFIAYRTMLPRYDVRYRGYGFNKIVQVRHVASLYYRFVTHPSAFLIHSPHYKSGARHAFLEGKNLTLAKQLANSSISANSTSASQVSARHALTTNVSAKPVAASQQQEEGAAEQNQRYYELVSRLIRSFHEEVDMRGTATTVEDEATVRCMRYLPWWSRAGEDMKAVRVRQEVLDLQRPLARTTADGVAITWYERRVRARTLRRSRLVCVEAKGMPIA